VPHKNENYFVPERLHPDTIIESKYFKSTGNRDPHNLSPWRTPPHSLGNYKPLKRYHKTDRSLYDAHKKQNVTSTQAIKQMLGTYKKFNFLSPKTKYKCKKYFVKDRKDKKFFKSYKKPVPF
jgi:hypothetical protein